MSFSEEREYDESTSVILKLVSSETIICQVVSDTDKNMIIRDPYEIKVHSILTEEGVRSTIYYADWFLSSKNRIHILRKDHVMSAAIPDDMAKMEYRQIVQVRDHKNVDQPIPPTPDLNWDQDVNLDDQGMGRN